MDEHERELVPSRKPTDEEMYFFQQGYKEPVERVSRLEDLAKYFIGATSTVAGLFLAAYKLATGREMPDGGNWRLIVPFICWSLSILAFLFVLLPVTRYAKRDSPASWRSVYVKMGMYKYYWLWAGAVLFIVGMLSAVILLLM